MTNQTPANSRERTFHWRPDAGQIPVFRGFLWWTGYAQFTLVLLWKFNMRMHHTTIAALSLWAGGSALTMAAASTTGPDSYDMVNGNSGSYNYWDQSYSGAGCVVCDNALLSGGRGDLTDGIIATNNWTVSEPPAGNGPYVGWGLDPRITFRWASPVNITSVTFHFDDSDGAGGVSAPASVSIGGNTFVINEPVGSAPFAFTAGITFSGTDLVVQVNRKNAWVFLSEVEFNSAPVPEPGTYALMLAGLAAVCAAARRRRLA